MKAITFEAPQSRNLTLEQTSFKSAFKLPTKSQIRHQWLLINLSIRTWSRRTVAAHGTLLLWIAGIAAFLGFIAGAAEYDYVTATCAIIAMAAMTPEMTMMTYDTNEEEL